MRTIFLMPKLVYLFTNSTNKMLNQNHQTLISLVEEDNKQIHAKY